MRPPHEGESYEDVLADVSAKRATRAYLEVGVNAGNLFSRISADHAVGVDPEFCITQNIAENKQTVALHCTTSDRFFAMYRGDPFDLIFLDGLHIFEQLLRDFFNAERNARRDGLIGLHDCFPLSEEMADRSLAEAIGRGQNTPYPWFWTGDVWKVVPILRRYRPDLHLVCVDAPPTGLLFASNLDPDSRLLERSYHEIIDEFERVPNTMASIEDMYANVEMIDSRRITRELDHRRFFACWSGATEA